MRHALSLECIGDSFQWGLRDTLSGRIKFTTKSLHTFFSVPRIGPLVSKITGVDESSGRFKKDFLRGQKDYTDASGTGNRGVYLRFWLEPGLYEVNKRESWKRSRIYFLLVGENATAKELTKGEAIAWAKGVSNNSNPSDYKTGSKTGNQLEAKGKI